MFLNPVKGPFRLTQKFGERPEFYAKYHLNGHNGIDITGPVKGTTVPLVAPIAGQLIVAGPKGDYGLCVRIRSVPDDSGTCTEITLGHFASLAVSVGKTIHLGEFLGMMGQSGDADGLHSHVGVRYTDRYGNVLASGNGFDGYVDPLPFLACYVGIDYPGVLVPVH